MTNLNSATIKVFLVDGDPRGLRTAEISNWSGKAAAAPRTDLDTWAKREELKTPGVYMLIGTDPESGKPQAYIGEAESIASRISGHAERDFWVHIYAFFSKDENLTKAHIKYLEGRLIDEAKRAGRLELTNAQGSGAKLPESDRADMEVFLDKIQQLLPVLGTNLLVPAPAQADSPATTDDELVMRAVGVTARGKRTPDGFLVFARSEAVKKLRGSSVGTGNFAERTREQFLADGTLVEEGDKLVFTTDFEFTSPSGAASVIQGGNTNGLLHWKNAKGVPLGELESKGADL